MAILKPIPKEPSRFAWREGGREGGREVSEAAVKSDHGDFDAHPEGTEGLAWREGGREGGG